MDILLHGNQLIECGAAVALFDYENINYVEIIYLI